MAVQCSLFKDGTIQGLMSDFVAISNFSLKLRPRMDFLYIFGYPQEIAIWNGHCLSMKSNDKPYIIIGTNKVMANYDTQLKLDLEEQYPDQCHRIGKDNKEIYFLTVL